MSHYKLFNLAVATILSSAIPLCTSNHIAISQTRNYVLTETNSQHTTPVEQLSNSEIDLLTARCIEFVNFLAGTEIEASDKETLLNFSEHFSKDFPKPEHLVFLQNIERFMRDMKGRQPDLLTRFRIREDVFSELYFHVNIFRKNLAASSFADPDYFILTIVETVEEYNPVIVADEKSQLLVTDRDIDATVATQNFLASKAGKPRISRRDFSEAKIRQKFPNLSRKGQEFWANAETHFLTLVYQWSKLSSQQKQAILNKAFATNNSSPQQRPSARSYSNQNRPQKSPTNQRRTQQLSPETQRRVNQSLNNSRRLNEAIQEQITIEPIHNPAFDVPSY